MRNNVTKVHFHIASPNISPTLEYYFDKEKEDDVAGDMKNLIRKLKEN